MLKIYILGNMYPAFFLVLQEVCFNNVYQKKWKFGLYLLLPEKKLEWKSKRKNTF